MGNILRALKLSIMILGHKKIVWYLLWPSILSFFLALIVLFISWKTVPDALQTWVMEVKLGRWLVSAISSNGLNWILKLLLVLIIIPLAYIFAVVLVGAVAIPLILDKVGKEQFRHLVRYQGGSNWQSLFNALKYTSLYLVLLVLSLPLWFFPALALIISLLLTAWFNERILSYDVLMLHASADELVALRRQNRTSGTLLGLLSAGLAYIPFVNLLVPAITSLMYLFFMLDKLEKHRQLSSVL